MGAGPLNQSKNSGFTMNDLQTIACFENRRRHAIYIISEELTYSKNISEVK